MCDAKAVAEFQLISNNYYNTFFKDQLANGGDGARQRCVEVIRMLEDNARLRNADRAAVGSGGPAFAVFDGTPAISAAKSCGVRAAPADAPDRQ
jgi:hypothetical protein